MSCCQMADPQPHSPYLMDDSSRCKCEYTSERETEREGDEGRNPGEEKRERQIKGWDKLPMWYCQINRNPSYLCAHSFQSISLALFWKHREQAWVQSCPSTALFIFAKNVNTGHIPLFPNCCVKLPLQGTTAIPEGSWLVRSDKGSYSIPPIANTCRPAGC